MNGWASSASKISFSAIALCTHTPPASKDLLTSREGFNHGRAVWGWWG